MYKNIDIKTKEKVLEEEILKFWEDNDIMQKSIDNKKSSKPFIFFEGPPTANGKPGIHHMMARVLKDSICRFKTMSGYQVKRKAGWDTHGLPVEIEVQKNLDLKDRNKILEYGIETFNKKCRESVFFYESLWRKMTKEMGYWIDLNDPYITLDNNYIETIWWILKKFWEKDLLYKGFKVLPYCPKCGTAISSHEVALGYKETTDPSIFIKFKAKTIENTYFLAWTTTPWTLISNLALVVNPQETYVKISHQGEFLILAEKLLKVIEEEYQVVEKFSGFDLEYLEYEPLFPYCQEKDKKAFFIACNDYVSMEDGSGIVHTAPAFGAEDYETGKKYNLPLYNPVDSEGKFVESVKEYANIFVKDADKDIIKNLKERGLLYRQQQIKHTYPFCWRCQSPLIYYARDSWFIKTTKYKKELISENKKINWYPNFVGENRFGTWLENNVDWAISRDRFWGTPLPIWKCEKCNKTIVVESVAELLKMGKMKDGSQVDKNIDLHRPYIDEVILTCPDCGEKMQRVEEVMDCWFDSGAMPFAQRHYPFENKENFDSLYPADFICEGIDQTRGWFYSLLAISVLLTGKASYKNVLVNDLILDKNGEKMSKSKGNVTDPFEIMEKYGADASRWYLVSSSPVWVPMKFNEDDIKEVLNKFFGTLKNIYSFFVTYSNIDNFKVCEEMLENHQKTAEIDIWIFSKLNNLIDKVKKSYDNYDLTKASRAIQNFVIEDLSNWYIRRSRRRYWSMTLTQDKKDAYITLFQVLSETAKLIAPISPFIAENIYSNLNSGNSVHLRDFPVFEPKAVNAELEKKMDTVISLVTLGRIARNSCQIKVRQTLSQIKISEKYKAEIENMHELIKEEINVKNISFILENEEFVEYKLKPNYKFMGPKFGKDMKKIADYLDSLTPEETSQIVKKINFSDEYILNFSGKEFALKSEDIQISVNEKSGYVIETKGEMYLALDIHLSQDLINEGYAREIVNKIQFTRKENKFEIMDKINFIYFADDILKKVIDEHKDYIKTETLSENIILAEKQEDMQKWDINDQVIYFKLEKNN